MCLYSGVYRAYPGQSSELPGTSEFEDLIVVTVYTPNSQGPGTERHLFRVGIWDYHFRNYTKGEDIIILVLLKDIYSHFVYFLKGIHFRKYNHGEYIPIL